MRTLKAKPNGKASSVNTSSEDNLLLQRIGTHRDRVAFEELYSRHKQKAYSLALHITGKQHLAEEAVQDAMLVVWLQADRFIPGNGRAWLLSVVAHKCLQLARKKSRKDVPLGSDQQFIRDRKGSSIEEDCSESEATAKLREMVSNLPAPERSLLAMYYTGELSQDHISKLTQTPQRSVSTQLKRILEKLRLGMLKAGLASTTLLPKAISEVTEDSLFEVFEPSDELGVRLMQRLTDQPSLAIASASGGGLHFMKNVFWALGAVALVALSIRMGVFNNSDSPNVPSVPAVPATSVNAVNITEPGVTQSDTAWSFPAPRQRPFKYNWSFANGALDDVFPIVRGAWKAWRPAKGKRPAAMVAPNGVEHVVAIVFPVRLPDANFKVRVIGEINRAPGLVSGISFCWVNEDRSEAPYRHWRKMVSVKVDWHTAFEVYFRGPYLMSCVDKKLGGLRKFEDDGSRHWLAMVAHGVSIQSIELKELATHQFPATFQDPKALFSSVPKESGWTLGEKVVIPKR